MKPAASTRAVPFAHLLGIKAAKAETDTEKPTEEDLERWEEEADEDPERKRKEDEDDIEYARRMRAMDEEDREEELEKEQESASASASDAGDEDEKKDSSAKASAARMSERARCARIIAAGLKAGAVHQAAALAFDTGMNASAAIATLSNMSSLARLDAKRGGIVERMAAEPSRSVGAGAPSRPVESADRAQAQADAAIAAARAVRASK